MAHDFYLQGTQMNQYIPVAARLLLAQLFVVTTVIQFGIFMSDPNGYENFRMYLGQHGLAGIFAPLMILVQVLGGAALLLGFKTRMAAWVMAGYAIFIAFALRLNEPILFMQYLAIAGGLLLLAVISPTACSLDNLRKKG
jgi:putative oxidoreductase